MHILVLYLKDRDPQGKNWRIRMLCIILHTSRKDMHRAYYIHTVDENIIGAPKMINIFWGELSN
jgi:hypothetical protein